MNALRLGIFWSGKIDWVELGLVVKEDGVDKNPK
jgi:hypothetical protein